MGEKKKKIFKWDRIISLASRGIAATIVVKILFACSEAKRLERIACLPPK
jgi:hypothetical protein